MSRFTMVEVDTQRVVGARVSRRQFAASALGLLALGAAPGSGASSTSGALSVRVSTIVGRRVLLAMPVSRARVVDVGADAAGAPIYAGDAGTDAGVQPPLRELGVVVLLHGLGEAYVAEIGARAWVDRYGLLGADARLRTPPVTATASGYLPAVEAARISTELGERPFSDLVYVCPHMPVPVTPAYAQWLAQSLVPALRAELPGFTGDPVLAGCSLGGHASISAATAYPTTFPLLACTQAAIGVSDAPRIADELASAGVRKMYFATSAADPYREANVALVKALQRLGKDVTGRTLPGPHDQAWLKDAGTLDLVHWASRAMMVSSLEGKAGCVWRTD
jgi:hypothetical protein